MVKPRKGRTDSDWSMFEVVKVEDIQDVEGAKIWMAEHDGRINAWWANQFKVNEGTSKKFNDIFKRLGNLEKRVLAMSAAGGLGGAIVGVFGVQLITKLMGGG